jgi:EmrB/QacA subfamily drug resistance transporter
MYSIDATAVAVAFPHFIRDLHTNVLWAAWTISIFFIAVTIGMPLAGNLSDSFGRKKVFLISLALFTLGSLACGLAPNILALIAARFLQGIGGAAFLPTASGMVSDHFPENRARAIGFFTSIFPIGGIIGPNLGGWIVSHYSWRYIFYINLPIGVCLFALIMVLLKDSRMSSRPRVDIAGALLMSATILFLMLGLNLVGESFSALSLAFSGVLLASSFVLGLLFLRQEKRVANPILDMVLLQSKPFLAANLLNFVLGTSVFGIFSFIPLYATSVHGLSTLMSGMIMTPRSIGTISASAITSFFLARWGYRWPMIIGFGIVSAATILLAPGLLLWDNLGALWGPAEMMALLLLVSGLGMGMAFPAANNACIELMPGKVATIVALRNMFRTIGGALGVSVITFILHLAPNSTSGFRIVFVSLGLTLLFSLPLGFLMPTGKEKE